MTGSKLCRWTVHLFATFHNYLSRKRESSRSKVYTKIKHLWITNVTYFIGRKTRCWIIKNTKHFKSFLRIQRDIPYFKNVKIKVNHEFIKGQISKKKPCDSYHMTICIFRSNYLIQTGTLLNEVRNDRQEKIERLKIGIVEVKVSDQK